MSNNNTTRRKTKSGGLWMLIFILLFAAVTLIAAKLITDRAQDHPGSTGYGSFDGESIDLTALEALANEDGRVKTVLENIDEYPETFIQLLLTNPDARDYVLNYPSRKDDASVGTLTAEETSGGIPPQYQWDGRWGYTEYGSGKLGITGCGPTCLSMVAVGLTGNSAYTPAAVAKYSEANGHYVYGSGSAWSLMTDGAASFGLSSAEVPLWEESMIAELEAGHPIIANVGPGDFTSTGHFIVITGYQNGMFIINDPNSPTKSAEGWYYTTLEKQITNMWAFSAA